MKIIALIAIATSANAAFGHDGHALQGAHWHATDAWGFAALGLVVATAIWMSHGGK